jgi:prepilin-type N-terminal cleavage/methylation domain-containing protein
VRNIHAFSLIELLVALAVLGVVATIVVPKFLGLREQAQSTAAQQIQKEINVTYANWKAAGGTESRVPNFQKIYEMLTKPIGVLSDSGDGKTTTFRGIVRVTKPTLQDSELSKEIRMTAFSEPPKYANSLAYLDGGAYIGAMTGNGSDPVIVKSEADVANMNWSRVNRGNPSVGSTPLTVKLTVTNGSDTFVYDNIPMVWGSSGTIYAVSSSGAWGRCEYTVVPLSTAPNDPNAGDVLDVEYVSS